MNLGHTASLNCDIYAGIQQRAAKRAIDIYIVHNGNKYAMGDVHGDLSTAAYAHAHVSLPSFFFLCYLLALFRISLPMRGVVSRLSLILDHIPYYVVPSTCHYLETWERFQPSPSWLRLSYKATVAYFKQKVFHHVSIADGEPLWLNIYL